MRLVSWWRKRQKEKKRLALLALVRKVREEEGDYDRDPVKRRIVQRQTQSARFRNKGRAVRKAVPSKLR